MWGLAATLTLRYSAGPGPSALEPGALKQVEQRHGGLTDIHGSRVNVPFRHRALERYISENWEGGIELGKQVEVLCCLLCMQAWGCALISVVDKVVRSFTEVKNHRPEILCALKYTSKFI